MPLITTTLVILTAYLIGSISSAIIVCKLMHLPDPRSQGSNNPGATNVLRIGGRLPAAITLLGDVLKGVLPVFVAKWLALDAIGLSMVAFAAFIGHLYPIYFRFHGGKGVATLIGCITALSWPVGLCWILTWLVVTFAFRYVSLASMIASLLTPVFAWLVSDDLTYIITFLVMALIVVYRHLGNIKKLLSGNENKIGG